MRDPATGSTFWLTLGPGQRERGSRKGRVKETESTAAILFSPGPASSKQPPLAATDNCSQFLTPLLSLIDLRKNEIETAQERIYFVSCVFGVEERVAAYA